jgi:hypothetical protein
MVDKLNVVVPRAAEFSREFAAVYRDVGGDPKYFQRGKHYEKSGNLQKLGYDVMLDLFSTRPDSDGNHKVQLLKTADFSYKQLLYEITRIFDIDPLRIPRSMKLRIPGRVAGQYEDVTSLPVRRVDLACDVPEHDVIWFKDRMRVQFKQFGAKIGKMGIGEADEHGRFVVEYAEMGMKGIQTLYFGKRPNCLRVYDKTAERMNDYKRVCRNASEDAELPSFEACYGFPSDKVLTRVEREMGSSVPRAINTLDRLQRNAPEFNPFDKVRIHETELPLPNVYEFDKITYLAGLQARRWVQEHGYDWFFRWCNLDGNGNGHRVLKRLDAFINVTEEGQVLNSEALYERYRDSVEKQLAA